MTKIFITKAKCKRYTWLCSNITTSGGVDVVMLKILETIKSQYRNYSTANKQVANVILSHPNEVVKMSIAKLANLSKVSQPTIMRFCSNVGFDSYKEFKFQLARELSINENYIHRGISKEDNSQSIILTVGMTTISVLNDVINQLDEQEIENITTIMANASQLFFWGHGASAAVAQDAYHKFFRVGVPCSTTSDSHMQCMLSAVMKPGNVIIAISHTGRSSDLIRNVQMVKQSGGTVIGITRRNSPLAKVCNKTIEIVIDENTDIYTPMLSRLAHLLILDILTVGVILQKGDQAVDRMKQMKTALLSIKSLKQERN